ncbi:hypothetical protein [Aliarcobacter vitoriensis]|uniref:Uncharacterized protein n=1 Tax=Aliarcobacter vitoriensis TaxID=2011099 RepID=A0A366MTA2_9BACT|nr:hypothetical protein [Aliarcobacter vitoriensis]RBQ29481.1 hypothetical protein CRU91_03885 [Aliarcobacter vitoriensis]
MIEDEKIDYDKNPIEIKDYNTLFMFLVNISLIPVLIFVYINHKYNPGEISEASLYRNLFIIIPFAMSFYMVPYIKSRGKRKIVLTNTDIKFMHENKIIEEIKISEITNIKKTYIDMYHKSQNLKSYQRFGLLIVFPLIAILSDSYYILLIIPFMHIFLVITKYLFHKLKDENYKYKFFDAILVYSGDKFINILPTTNNEYEKVRKYFLDKNLGDIQNKNIYFKLFEHSFERIKFDRH